MSTLTNIDSASTRDAVGIAAPAASAPTKPVQSGIRSRTVLLYLVVACVVLLPGIALRIGVDAAKLSAWGLGTLTDLHAYLAMLQQALQDIEFGNGLRFWLGVAGTTMLALLLLYPLRKALANRRGVGSVGGWFHLHSLLGIAAPVLILYHSNFRHGSLNANVALWTMLLVAFSGIVGFFVYARVSASFYTSRQQALTHRNAVLASIAGTVEFQARKGLLIAKFEAFEAELLTPRQGLRASIRARLRLERHRREMTDDIAGLVSDTARARSDSAAAFQQFRTIVGRHVRAYFGIARAAASQSMREQMWSRWRLLHMPVFLIMLVATLLHVVAVWDGGGADLADADDPASVRVASAPAAHTLATTNAAATASASAGVSAATTPQVASAQAPEAPRPAPPPGLSVRVVKPQILPVRPTAAAVQPKPLIEAAPATAPVPQLARRPVPVPVPAPQLAAAPVIAAPAIAAPILAAPILAAQDTPPAPPQGAITELQRRLEPPMALGANLGGGKVSAASLDDMFAAFKAKRQTGEFSHSDLETGFNLTGKHLKVECASCHTAPLPATRQNTAARACIDCHKKDDNHSGSRPDCAKCHTTNRWKQRIR